MLSLSSFLPYKDVFMETRRNEIELVEDSFVAVGYFDGVHRGHAAVISAAVSGAKKAGAKSVVLSFDMSRFRADEKGEGDLVAFSEREELIEKTGANNLYILDFEKIMDMDGGWFVKEILSDRLHAKRVFCGEDFRFSKGRGCGAKELFELCRVFDIEVDVVSAISDGGVISTTRIKELVKNGSVAEAKKLLGHALCYGGEVERGKSLAYRLGFPTANVPFPKGVVPPRFGVYWTRTHVDNLTYDSITNIGIRPTFEDDRRIMIETYLLDYEGDLYGKPIKAELVEFLRDEKKFEGEGELKAEVERNIAEIRKKLHLSKKEKLK